METVYNHDLIEVDTKKKEAIFKNTASGESVSRPYDFLHAVPKMGPPSLIKLSGLG